MKPIKPKPPVCCGEVVLNNVNGKDFWYCRGCKQEVYLTHLTMPTLEDRFTDTMDLKYVTMRPGQITTFAHPPVVPFGGSTVRSPAGHAYPNNGMISKCLDCGYDPIPNMFGRTPQCPGKPSPPTSPCNTIKQHNVPATSTSPTCVDCGADYVQIIMNAKCPGTPPSPPTPPPMSSSTTKAPVPIHLWSAVKYMQAGVPQMRCATCGYWQAYSSTPGICPGSP